MTKIFMYGSIDMGKAFGVTDISQVSESLKPYLHTDSKGNLRLNVVVKNKREASGRYTHELIASKKGVKGSFTLCDIVEYQHDENTDNTPKNDNAASQGNNGIDMPF